MPAPPRPIITLTTDFGHQDFHLPRLKGALLSHCPPARLVDVTHDVAPYDITEAAHVLGRCWRHFPTGTIHLLSVYDFYQPRGRYLLLRHGGHGFVGPDNGVFGLLLPGATPETHVLDRYAAEDSLFQIYARAVGHLAAGGAAAEIASPVGEITERLAFQPVIGPNYIRGTALYVDRFDNVTTNVSRKLFERVGRGRGFQLLVRRNEPIDGLSFRYHDVPQGEALCRFNSDELLEIAVNLGRAATLLGIRVEDTVQIDFH